MGSKGFTAEAVLFRARSRSDEISTRAEEMADRLRAGMETPGDPRTSDPMRVIADLRIHQEELLVCIEELRSQRDAMAEGHALVEREHAKYLELFERAPDAYIATDWKGVITDANRLAGELLAVPFADLPGRILIAFVARRDTRPFREQLQSLGKSQVDRLEFETNLRPRGGHPFRASLAVTAVRLGNRHIVAYRWTIRRQQSLSPPASSDGDAAASPLLGG